MDVVWCAPVPWEADAARRALVVELAGMHGLRVLYCCPDGPPDGRLHRRSGCHRWPVPIGESDRIWLLGLGSADEPTRGRTRAASERNLLHVIGALGLGRPVFVMEDTAMGDVVGATGWASVDLAKHGALPLDDPAELRRLVQAAVDGRSRNEERLAVTVLDHCARLSGGELALARMLPACTESAVRVILAEDGPLVERLEREGIAVSVSPMVGSAHSVAKDAVVPGVSMVRAAFGTVRYSVALAKAMRRDGTDLVVATIRSSPRSTAGWRADWPVFRWCGISVTALARTTCHARLCGWSAWRLDSFLRG